MKAYAAAFKRLLPRSRLYPDPWSTLQVGRLTQSLNKHRLAGLTPEDVVAGIGTHLRATDRGWQLDWDHSAGDGSEQQARWLAAHLRDAHRAERITQLPVH